MSEIPSSQPPLSESRVNDALAALRKKKKSLENLTLRSHLLRYVDRYEDERKLLRRVAELGFSSDYFDSRAAWHALPLFDQLVPRAPLDLPKDPRFSPGSETLEQLCFVTALGSDQPYFNVGFELLESIKNTQTYRDIPICILDTGLTDEHRHLLLSSFGNLTITDPGLDLDIVIPPVDFLGKTRSVDGLKGCLARPFIPRHFPGYRYYLWFDTDIWIQDERTIDRFVTGAVEHGVCSVVTPNVTPDTSFPGGWWHQLCERYQLVPDHSLAVLLQSDSISAGTFCIDRESGFFELWAKSMTELIHHSGQVWGPDELGYMLARQLHFPGTPVLSFQHNFKPYNAAYGLPIYSNSCLMTPYSAEPIGIFHFCGMKKDQWFAPLIESEVPVDLEMNKAGKGERRDHSIHFRVWPWQDKPAIAAFVTDRLKALLPGETHLSPLRNC